MMSSKYAPCSKSAEMGRVNEVIGDIERHPWTLHWPVSSKADPAYFSIASSIRRAASRSSIRRSADRPIKKVAPRSPFLVGKVESGDQLPRLVNGCDPSPIGVINVAFPQIASLAQDL